MNWLETGFRVLCMVLIGALGLLALVGHGSRVQFVRDLVSNWTDYEFVDFSEDIIPMAEVEMPCMAPREEFEKRWMENPESHGVLVVPGCTEKKLVRQRRICGKLQPMKSIDVLRFQTLPPEPYGDRYEVWKYKKPSADYWPLDFDLPCCELAGSNPLCFEDVSPSHFLRRKKSQLHQQ